ncbi:MAG: hypothetical protein AAFP86_01945 [Planctomycetota bacterium]
MNRIHAALLGAVLPAALLAHASASAGVESAQDERLDFERQDDLGLRISHTVAHLFSDGRASLQRGDGDERELPNAFGISSRISASVVDEPRGAARNGARRVYVSVAGALTAGAPQPDGEVFGPEVKLASPLTGRGVAFVPTDGAPAGFGRHYDTVQEADERFLPRLEPPTDWSALAPTGDVTGLSVGDEWDVDASALRCVLAPVGFLGLDGGDPEVEGETPLDPRMRRALQSGVGGNLQVLFDGRVDGRARARVTERAVDGRDGMVSVVEIEFLLTSASDRTAQLGDAHALGRGEPDTDVLSASVEFEIEGKATLRWSPELRRPTLVDVTAEESIVFTVGLVGESQEVSVETLRLSGAFQSRTAIGDALLLGSSRER